MQFDDLTGLDKSPATGGQTYKNFYPNLNGETPNCTFSPSATVVDMRGMDRAVKYYIGFGVQDNASECTGIKFRGKYKVSVID